jgi:endonuclease/exonuclease/phosphatase family metal-dependent hydrolase
VIARVRIATWNCYRGRCLERAEELAPLGPDIAVLQECAQPATCVAERSVVWSGSKPTHGVAVVAHLPFAVSRGPVSATLDHTAFPAVITGPMTFHLLAIWALPRPSYVRAVLKALETYDHFLRSAPSVVIGDFNCFAHWHGEAPSKAHVELARRLRDDLSLVSAYHNAPAYDPTAREEPTYFFRWEESRPFHIDYCFVPAAWRPAIRSVQVRGFGEQQWRSDHRPVIVDLDLPGALP